MKDEEKLAWADAYVVSAYASMGRSAELPETAIAIGICLHWAAAGSILSLSEWMDKMEPVQTTPSGLSFTVTRDGITEPLLAPGMRT